MVARVGQSIFGREFFTLTESGWGAAVSRAGAMDVTSRAGTALRFNNFRMGPGSGLISANHDENDYDQWVKSRPIRIGDNVWLGMNVVVLPGIHIGDNVVVGAGSVVTKDIPSNVVAAGNPCRVIRDKAPYAGLRYGESAPE